MMKRQKWIACLMVLVLLAGILAGCSGSGEPAAPASQSPASEGDSANAPAQETTTAPVNYPNGEMTILIPSGAGGGNDLTTRALIPGMQEVLGATIVPMNKGESNGVIAATELANANPDGQLLYFNSQTLILMPHSGMPDIKMENYQPVAQVVEDNGVIYVNASSDIDTLEDFLEKTKTRNMKVGHNGVGAIWHLAAVQLAEAADVEYQYVAYTSGGAAMLTALAAGEIDMCIVNPSEGKALVDAGQVKPIAVMGNSRLAVYSDAPTCQELGLDIYFPIWRGLFTTAGVSEEILDILDDAVKAATETDEFISYCENNSLPIAYKGHKEFTEIFENDIIKFAELMQNVSQ